MVASISRTAGFLLGRRRGRRAAGFILLEVVISLVVLGISVATLMRSFTLSLRAISKNEVATQACVLGEGLVQAFELEPPTSRTSHGSFEEQGYPNFSWEAEYEEEEIQYKNLKTKSKIRDRDLRSLQRLTVKIIHDNGRSRSVPVELDVYLLPVERFNYNSKNLNELFRDEETRRY